MVFLLIMKNLFSICLFLIGLEACTTNQGLANFRRFCLQDFRSREETWKSHSFHNVPPPHNIIHLNAAVLLLGKL